MNKVRLLTIMGVAVIVMAGGVLLFQQVSSEPGCDGDYPCMLYFYAKW